MARSRRRSWGSIKTVSRDKHIIRWTQNTPDGRKRCTKTVHGTYREACLELDRLHVELAEDKPVPTVSKAWTMWAEPYLERSVDSGRLKEVTAGSYERSWRLHIEPRWGRVPVDSVKPCEVQEWLLGLSPATADACLKTLRLIFRYASQWCEVADPVNGRQYEMPAGGNKRDAAIYTGDEMRLVAEHLRGTSIEAPYLLAAYGGCRSGESLGVKACEVGRVESGGHVYAAMEIVRQMPDANGEPMPEGRLKNESSRRVIVLPPPASERLLELADESWMWLADQGDGLPMGRSALTHRWHKFMEGAPVERIPFSNLRNSWRTMMLEELHMPWEVAEQLMGHRLPGVSGQHYIRPTKEQQVRAAVDAFDAHLG